MEVVEIKKIVSIRPFEPFEFHLDDGAVHLITHPEIIVTDSIIAALDQDEKVVLITPESIQSINFKD